MVLIGCIMIIFFKLFISILMVALLTYSTIIYILILSIYNILITVII